MPLRLQLALEGVEADLQRVGFRLGQHGERPEELVPAPHHREDRQHGECRHGERHDDAPVDLPLRGLVHAGGLDQIARQRQHVLPQQEDARRRRRARQDHRPERVHQPEFGDDQIDRHEDDRDRDHQRADHHQHHRVLASEFVDRQRIGRHRVDDQRDDRRHHRDEDGVPQEAREGEALQRLGVILGRELEAANGRALVDGDADHLGRVGRVDHLRLDADAPHLRQNARRTVRHRHRKQRQRLGMAGDHDLLLRHWQQRGREFEEACLRLERRQGEPQHRPEHQDDAHSEIGVGRDIGPVPAAGFAARGGELGDEAHAAPRSLPATPQPSS